MTLDQISILNVWAGLGGGELPGYRGRAFWRDGDGFSISIDVKKNVWYDFRDAEGGGVLYLVMIATGCSKSEALVWLEQNAGLDSRRPLSPSEKREYALRAAGTERLAIRLADFARGLELIAEKTVMDLYSAMVETGIDVPETLGQHQRELFILKTAHSADIAHMWRNMRTAAGEVERIGREDREHAEFITNLLVELVMVSSADRMAA